MRLVVVTTALLGAYFISPSAGFLLPTSTGHRHARAPLKTMMAAGPSGGATPISSPLLQQLQADYPRVSVPYEFIQGIQPSDACHKSDSERALVRAQTFANLAPRALLARGLDAISDDFEYFSPSTGRLSRSEYMGLVALLERALPNLRLTSAHFQIASGAGGGAVSFLSRTQGAFTGELLLGDLVVAGTGAKYKGDVELNLVSFNSDGLLQSFSTGLLVPEAGLPQEALAALGDGAKAGSWDGDGEDREEDDQVLDLRRRLESQAQKLSTTPEGTAAWEKITADIEATQRKLDAYQKEGELVRTSGGHGGLGGILYALGVEHTGTAVSLEGMMGVAELDDITMELDLVSIPSECETMLEDTMTRVWEDVTSSSS